MTPTSGFSGSGIGVKGSLTDAATSSITSGGTSQSLFSATSNREGFIIQNLSSGDLWINFGAAAAAAAPSIKLVSGATFIMEPPGFIDTRAINVFGATTGQAFTAKEG